MCFTKIELNVYIVFSIVQTFRHSNNHRKAQLVSGIDRKSNEGCIADCRHSVITRCSALQTSLFKTTMDCGRECSARWMYFVRIDWHWRSSISRLHIFNLIVSLKKICELVYKYTINFESPEQTENS